jgi:hypothetical protein
VICGYELKIITIILNFIKMRFSILALALAGLATLALSKDHIKHNLKGHHHHEVADPTPWPSVIVPFNFEYEV